MEEKQTKKRAWVKNAIIIFLAVMLLLVLFSNTINNWSLPEVKGQYAGYGNISTSVRGTGNVEANMSYTIQLDRTRQIKSVLIRAGDTVEAGQEIFTLEEEEETEGSALKEALDELETMKYNYQVKLVNEMPDDYVQSYNNIARMKEDLTKMQSELGKAASYEADYKIAKADTARAQDQVDAIQDSMTEINEAMAEIDVGEGDVDPMFTAALKAAQQAQKDAEDYVEQCTRSLADLEAQTPYSEETLTEQLEAARRELEDMKLQLRYDSEDYERMKEDEETSEEALIEQERKMERETISIGYKEEEIKDLEQKLAAAQGMSAAVSDARARLENAKLMAEQKAADTERAQEALDQEKERIQEAADQQTKALISNYKQQLAALKDQLKAANSALKDAQDAEQEALEKVNTQVTEEAIKQKQRDIQDAELALSKEQEQAGVTNKLKAMELERDLDAIHDKEAEIEKLRGTGGSSVVTTKYAGTVTSVSVVAGDTVAPGDVLAGIDVEAKGYTLTVPVTAEQARQLHVGDRASAVNYWWGSLDIILTAVKTDRNSQTGGRLAEFTVTGDITEGQSLTVSVGERQTGYDVVVPKSAVHEDTNGNYIYVAKARSTPLGNRYIATRVDVTVIAQDNYNCAVDGGSEFGYEYVITTASKPVTAGTQVRLVDDV